MISCTVPLSRIVDGPEESVETGGEDGTEEDEEDDNEDADVDVDVDSSMAVTKSLGFLLLDSEVRGDIISDPLFLYSASDIKGFFL